MSMDAQTPTTVYDDGKHIRTAIVMSSAGGGSLDIVDGDGVRIGQINIFLNRPEGTEEEMFMVDVIDIDRRYTTKRGLTFQAEGKRTWSDTDYLVASDMRR